MHEIVWQYDETTPHPEVEPDGPTEARRLLMEGNHAFAHFFDEAPGPGGLLRHVIPVSRHDLGLGDRPGEAPRQEPFAAVLGCADARVPIELIFGRQANDLFIVRVAGNVLGSECLGSVDYAVNHIGTVKLLAVLGHTGCGAVTAAVDAYLTPAAYLDVATNFPLQSIVSALMAAVRGAAHALNIVYGKQSAELPGYRRALIDLAVIVNAALDASVLAHTYRDTPQRRLEVTFGIYDLVQRVVGLPAPDAGWAAGLADPPADRDELAAFGRRMAASSYVRGLLHAPQ
ncbi:carbonic anhydrase [Promineifilum sp.]|uniref:carbonic anhydrase n=1 Tax=Promineifilum sp. TaxID=2664178 RepID=UPI0035B3E752